MFKFKKGFTLIELLAVIAIIAILAVIAIPNVLKLFNGAKSNALVIEAKEIYSATQKNIVTATINNSEVAEFDSEGNKLNVTTTSEYKVGITNNKITSICVSKNGKVINITNLISVDEINADKIEDGNCSITTELTISQVSTGFDFSAIVDSAGNLWTWGNNQYGELGRTLIGEETTDMTPTKLTLSSNIKIIDLNGSFAIAINSNNSTLSWGNNATSELGRVTTGNFDINPGAISISSTPSSIAAGHNYALVLDNSNNIWAWGWNHWGQLGNDVQDVCTNSTSLVCSNTPVKLTIEENGVSVQFDMISANSAISSAIDINGHIWTWGINGSYQLGRYSVGECSRNGGDSCSNTPTKLNIVDSSNNVVSFSKVSTGYEHMAVIDTNGYIWTWGSNSDGQLGRNTESTKDVNPVKLQIYENGTLIKFKNIYAGAASTLAMDTNNNLWTWGDNYSGELGRTISISGEDDDVTPTKLVINNGITFKNVAFSCYHVLAVDANNNLWTWGYNPYGQLGRNTTGISSETPTIVEIFSD